MIMLRAVRIRAVLVMQTCDRHPKQSQMGRTEGNDRGQSGQDGEVDCWTVMDKGGELDSDG